MYQVDIFIKTKNSKKLKGTAVALYIHNSLKANPASDLCKSTAHFESFFVTAMSGSDSITIGVTYHPPSGDNKQYLDEQ